MKRVRRAKKYGRGAKNKRNKPSIPEPVEQPSWCKVYIWVCLTCFVCYYNGLHGHLVHDDIPAVQMNGDVLATNDFWKLWSNDFWGMPMSDPNSHKSYRPLTVITFRLTHWLFGQKVFWYHLGNLVLHMACSCLFTRLLISVAKLEKMFVTFGGLLFATHPIHTEAVTGIVGRADVLAAFFFLLSFLLYHDSNWNRSRISVAQSCLLATASMLSKEIGITVLLVNLLYDAALNWNHLQRFKIERRLTEKIKKVFCRAAVLCVSMIILVSCRLYILSGSLPTFSEQDNPAASSPSIKTRFLTYCYLSTYNLYLMIMPTNLSHDWQMGSIPLLSSVYDLRFDATFICYTFILILIGKCVVEIRNRRYMPMTLGMLLLIVPFIPSSNLFFTVGFVVAERVLYIPSMGLILLVVYGSQILSHKYSASWPKFDDFLRYVYIALVVTYVGKTIVRNNDWLTRESLLKSGLKVVPGNAKMHYNWANFLRESGKYEQSRHHYKEALKLWPTYASAHNNLGTIIDNTREAERHFLAAIYYSPHHLNAHFNLGQIYRRTNKTTEAIAILRRCIHINPSYARAYFLLASLMDTKTSDRILKAALNIQPKNHQHFTYYASWLAANYRHAEAIYHFKSALQLSPFNQQAIRGLAISYRSNGDKIRSILVSRLYCWSCRDRLRTMLHAGSPTVQQNMNVTTWKAESKPVKTANATPRNENTILICDLPLTPNRVKMEPLLISSYKEECLKGERKEPGKTDQASDHSSEVLKPT